MLTIRPLAMAALLGTSVMATGCIQMPAKAMTTQEKEMRSEMQPSNFLPASRTMRDNIETQELFAQAAFWSREYDINPSDLEATLKLASAVRKMGNPDRAIEITQMGRALYPRDPYLGAEFAASLIAAERAGEAMPVLDEMITIAPAYARLWSLKGAALDQVEQYDQARKHYARAMQITPNDPNILTNIGLSYALAGDPQTAEGWLRRAAAMPGASAAVRENLNLVLQLQGKSADAAAAQAPQMQRPQAQRPPQAQMRQPQAAPPMRRAPMPTQTAAQSSGNVLDKIAANVRPPSAAVNPYEAGRASAPPPQNYNANTPPAGYPQAYAPQGYAQQGAGQTMGQPPQPPLRRPAARTRR